MTKSEIVFGAIILFVLSSLMGASIVDGYWKRDAVRHKAAKFVVDDEGAVKFVWNDEPHAGQRALK
jgi:hypothetical protein